MEPDLGPLGRSDRPLLPVEVQVLGWLGITLVGAVTAMARSRLSQSLAFSGTTQARVVEQYGLRDYCVTRSGAEKLWVLFRFSKLVRTRSTRCLLCSEGANRLRMNRTQT